MEKNTLTKVQLKNNFPELYKFIKVSILQKKQTNKQNEFKIRKQICMQKKKNGTQVLYTAYMKSFYLAVTTMIG